MSTPKPSVVTAPPGDQYDRLLSRFAVSGFPPLIIAVGLDERLLAALDRHDAATKVLAIEPVPAVMRKAVGQPHWQAWAAAGRLTVLVGPGYAGHADAWRLISREALQPPLFVDPELAQKFPGEAEAAKMLAKQIVRGAHANEEARRRFAGGYLLNTLTNLPTIASEGDAAALTGLFNDVPAIVVGAGPSLDHNLPALRAVQDRALLIAVDTAVRPLLAAGIRPHLAVSVDPSDTNARHLTDLPDVRGLWFLAEGSLAPRVFRQFAGRTFFFKVSNHEPWAWLAEHGADRGTLQTWGSVLTTAFDIALRVGCNPIVFAGADLAYSGGLQYCRNTIFEPDWSPFPTDAERAAEFAKYLQTRPHVTHQDVNGHDVTTAPHFIQFRDWIVAQTGSAAPRRIINATGGGILHGGRIEQIDLASIAFDALPPSGEIQQRFASAWAASTFSSIKVRDQLERAAAYGTPIPLQQWQAFGGDATSLDQVRVAVQAAAAQLAADRRETEFLIRHRDSYDRRITSVDDARDLSHGHYDTAAARAAAQQTHVLLDFAHRTYQARGANLESVLDAMAISPRGKRALDVGCGVGRSMEAMIDAGVNVDGVDISERMIHFARQNPKLHESSLFVSRGNDCGDAPDGSYDLVYSQLCFRYIRSRRVRNELLRAIARALKPGGIVVIEMRFFRGLSAATVPPPHVPWSAEDCDTSVEAGTADVCATADELHLLYDDFSQHFEDLRLQFVEVAPEARHRLPPQLYVSGSTRGDLASRIHASEPGTEKV